MFWKALPSYLAMGMTSEEFWYDDPRLAKAYREAQILKTELMNQEAWIHGLYVYDAVATAINNSFGGKGTKKQKYLEKPIELNPPKQTPEEAKRKVISTLDAWKEAWDKTHQSTNGDKQWQK